MPALRLRLAVTLLALSGVALAQHYQLEIVAGSVTDKPFSALRDGHSLEIESRTLQLRSIGRIDGVVVYELAIFREPATGQSLWLARLMKDIYHPHEMSGGLLANTAIMIEKNAMRAFSFAGLSVRILEAKTHCRSLDAGETPAIADFAGYLHSTLHQFLLPEDGHLINLPQLPPQSPTEHFDDRPFPATRLLGINRSGHCWRMIVDGPSGVDTPFLIDGNYDLSSGEACDQPPRPTSHVRLMPETGITVPAPALENNQPAKIELHYSQARITFPDGQIGRLRLFMLYDPSSRLFWWDSRLLTRTEPDPSAETDAKQFLSYSSFHIANGRIVNFSIGTAQESTERYPSFRAAQTHLLSVLERMRGNIQSWLGLPYRELDTRGIPRDFFALCGHAEGPKIALTRVERIGGLWQLTLSGETNILYYTTPHSTGEAVAPPPFALGLGYPVHATLSLNDNYETVSVRLSPEIPPAAIGRMVRSGTLASEGNGQAGNLEFREVEISHPGGCGGPALSRVTMVFDRSTHLSTWWSEWQSPTLLNPGVYETEGRIVAVSREARALTIRESVERHASWSDLQAHVLNLLWQGVSETYHGVDLAKYLPAEFLRRAPVNDPQPGPPRILHVNAGWQVTVTGANGQTAIVELDSDYKLIRATLQP
jgi:hypothetical protein